VSITTLDGTIDPLVAAFNRDAGGARLLLLVSPT